MKKFLVCMVAAVLLLLLTACRGIVFNADAVGLAIGGDKLDNDNAMDDGELENGISSLRIVVDPGHGGIDSGAAGMDTGVCESELNLQVSGLVAGLFADAGADVLMTRETAEVDYSGKGDTSKLKDMNNRASLVRNKDPKILVSIHMNACEDRSVSGAQVFYQEGGVAGEKLARCIQEKLNSDLNARDRSATSGDYFMMKVTKSASVIVECGFLSNHGEEKKLADPEYQQMLAECIFKGVCGYLGIQ